MASKSSRARKLERARVERRLARAAQRQRRTRQIRAGVGGALALVLVALGLTWIFGGFESKPEPVTLPSCTWTSIDPSADTTVTDTSLPPTSGETREGTGQLTIATDQGTITADVNLADAPCTAASLRYLGDWGFYDGTACGALDTSGAFALTCGDPKGDGTGGPSYQFPGEAIPVIAAGTQASPTAEPSDDASAAPSYYSKGTIALRPRNTNAFGSQFVIIYADGSNLPPEYSIIGTVTSGLDIVEGVAASGATDGKPNTTLTIQQLTLTEPPSDEPSTEPSAEVSDEPSPSPTA